MLKNNTYTDIDLVNSHFSILFFKANDNSIDVPYLNQLVTNRLEIFNTIVNSHGLSFSEVKVEFLKCLNLIIYKGNIPYLKNLHLNILKIRENIWLNYINNADSFNF